MNHSDPLNVERSALSVERSAEGGSASASADAPWPGLASFSEETQAFFHGRDAEVAELARRVQRKLLTILFGQSGLGKTSMLRAGVAPRLRKEGYCPVYVRLDYSRQSPAPAEQIRLALAQALPAGVKSTHCEGETLWEFLHHRGETLTDAEGRALIPLIVFDQFEEIFTLGQNDDFARERAAVFLDELGDLVENRAPRAVEEKLEKDEAAFERFDFGRSDYRLLISLREDYLPHLESLKHRMPSVTQNRMRLARMTGTQALDAVIKPGGALVTPEVARAIVEFVAGARGGSLERLAEIDVEPPLLSVICRELNERRRARGDAQISADLVTGNRREILTDFYDRSVADLPEGMRSFVEDKLLTKSGFRDNLALEMALEEPGVTRPLIDTLVSRRLLRIEDRLGSQRVELTHDVLAEVIRASRDTHQQQLAVEQARIRERITRRRMWLARTIAAGLLVALSGVSWVAWRAIRAEREQARLHEEADGLRDQAQAQELKARQKAYASDMNQVQQALASDNLGRAQRLLERQRPEPGQRDLRGWEWRYLWQFAQNDAQTLLTGKAKFNNTVSGSADGEWVAAAASGNGELLLWNLKTKAETRVPAGDAYVDAVFSPRDPLLAIALTDSTVPSGPRFLIRLWNPATRETVREIALDGIAGRLAFSPDGQVLLALRAVAGKSREITLWDVSSGTQMKSFPVNGATFPAGAIHTPFTLSADFRFAAYGSSGGTFHVVDLGTGREIWRAKVPRGNVICLAFSPDGKLLASGAGFVDPTIRLWDRETHREVGTLEGHRTFLNRLVFLPDGKTLASGSADQTIRLWDVPSRTAIKTLRGHTLEVYGLALLADKRTLVSGSNNGFVYLWDTTKDRAQDAAVRLPKPTPAWRFAPDSKSIVTVDSEGRVERWSGPGFQQPTMLMELAGASSALIAPTGSQIATLAAGGLVQVWDLPSKTLSHEFNVPAAVRLHSFLDGEKRLIIGSGEGEDSLLKEWDVAAQKEVLSWKGSAFGLFQEIAVSADERQVLFREAGGAVNSIFDRASGRTSRLGASLASGQTWTFSPDGRLIAGASVSGGNFLLWDAVTHRELATVSDFLQGARHPAFSPDGGRLAVSSTGREAVKLWDLESLENLLTFQSDRGFGRTKFSPDGNVLAASGDGVIHLWTAPSWEEIARAEQARVGAVRNLAGSTHAAGP